VKSDVRVDPLTPSYPHTLTPSAAPVLKDKHGRTIRYLRLSVTDRCNQRCVYCLPEDAKPEGAALSWDQLFRLARAAVGLGIDKVRVTGGEPLLRKGVPAFVRRLADLPGVKDVSLTTNGVLLAKQARELRDAGLTRLNLSVDSLRRDRYQKLTRRDDLAAALEGYETARRLGFKPIKVNCVVIRGVNDDEVADFAEWARRDGVQVRFIEFMPMGVVPWGRDRVVPGAEILARLREKFDLVPADEGAPDDPARHAFRVKGSEGSLGFINTISEPFCGACSRLRITAQGTIRPCLLNDLEIDLKPFPDDDALLTDRLKVAVGIKPPRHYVNDPTPPRVQKVMAAVGG
jgi:cyclic pyranopterin phosphate synthase